MVCKMPYKVNNVSVNSEKKIVNNIKTVSDDDNNITTSPVIMDDLSTNNEDPLEFQRITGGSLIDYPPIFGRDDDRLYVQNDNMIQVYSLITGEWIKDFSKAPASIVGLQHEINDSDILIGCTKNGDVIRWETKTGDIQTCIKLPLDNFEIKTFNLLDLKSKNDEPYALVTYKTCSIRGYSILNIYTGEELICPFKIDLTFEDEVHVVVDSAKFYNFAIAQNAVIYFANYKNWKLKKCLSAKKHKITCIHMHPEMELMATGDEHGQIYIWRAFWTRDMPLTSLYHWHHMPLTTIAFSATGSSFYSGGYESTLVKWSLKNLKERKFFAHLPSVIVNVVISKDNERVVVCFADNSIQVYSQDELVCTLQTFTYVNDYGTGTNMFPVGLEVNPRNNCVILNGRVGHLQFFSTYTKSLLYNFDVVLQNRMPLESENILFDTQVTRADFNVNWMATSEVCDDQIHLPELRIKFWKYQEEQQNYELNTNIELPHEGGIKSIKFSNKYETDSLLCATIGNDNFIKIWSLEDSYNTLKEVKSWYCVARTNYKNLPIDSISFSEDGSLLAAGFGNTLCVYKAANLNLKAALSAPCGFDGSARIAKVQLVKNDLNGSRSMLNKQKCLQLFKNLLENNDQTLFTTIKKTPTKTKSKLLPIKLNEKQRETLFRRILEMNELSLFKKITLYEKLGISCIVNDNNSKQNIRKNLHRNLLNANKSNSKLWNCISTKSQFKTESRTSTNTISKSVYKRTNEELVPLLNLLNLNTKAVTIPQLNSYSSSDNSVDTKLTDALTPITQICSIRHVLFATNEFAHIVIVCTDDRILFWNLLTLRLQNVLKLSVKHLTIDPLTNLVAAFTTNNELFVFLPNIPMSIYNRKNMPETLSACWIPRRYPKSHSISVDWQSVSTLYFLTTKQEILFLATDNELETLASSTAVYLGQQDENPKFSIFGAFAAYQTTDKVTNISKSCVDFIGERGKGAVQSLIEMPSHTMPPLNLISTNFLQAIVGTTSKSQSDESEMNSSSDPLKAVVDDNQIDSDDEEINRNVKVQNRKALASVIEQQKHLLSNEITSSGNSIKDEMILKKILSQSDAVELFF